MSQTQKAMSASDTVAVKSVPPGSATLKVRSGLHARTAFQLLPPSRLVGSDPECDMVLFDLDGGRIVFDLDDNNVWHVTAEAGQLVVDGASIENYAPHRLIDVSRLVINGVRLKFVPPATPVLAALSALPDRADAGELSNNKLQTQLAGAAAPAALATGFRRHALPAAIVTISIAAVVALPGVWRLATHKAEATPLSAPINAVTAVSNPATETLLARQQISDYLNSFRLPIAIQSVSADRIDLAWLGVDTLSLRVQQQIGTKLHGRDVAWVSGAHAVNDSYDKQPANRSTRQAAVDRGNRQTEETLRNLGLLDIASVQVSSDTPRYVLTRTGHRLYEGSELKTGATLVTIKSEELVVRSNDNTLLVPYDVSKPVRRLTNGFTTSAANAKQIDVSSAQTPAKGREMNLGTPLAMLRVSKELSREN